MRLRLGFIGVGGMGRSHIETFLKVCADRSACVAVCDTNEASVNLARQIIPEAIVYKHSHQMLASEEIDAVVISTPNHTHAELIIDSLKSGKHVMCEKPIAITMEDCTRVKLTANASDRVCMIGHELRYGDYFQKIKSLIDVDVIGELTTVWCKEFRPPFLEKVDDWIQDTRLSGGSLVEKNCHHFDLMNWWVDSSPKTVIALGRSCRTTPIPPEYRIIDHATVSFEYNNGVTGTLMLNLSAPDRHQDCLEMGLIGDKGMIQTQLSKDNILVWTRDRKDSEDSKDNENNNPTIHHVPSELSGFGGHHGFEPEHTAFLDAIEHKTPLLTDIHACFDGTALAITAEQSIVQKKIVELYNQ